MKGIPQERKWKLGKMYDAEGGGGPRLYIFKGVGLIQSFPDHITQKVFFYKIAINLSPLLKKYKTRLKKKQANKRPFRTRSKPRLENSKFKQRPTQAMQTFPQKRRFSQGTAHFSWLQSQWDHPGLSPCHGILLSAPVIRRGDWRVIPSRETRKVISHQTGYARKSWTQ